MGKPRIAQPVKLFCGLLGSDPDLLRRARQVLVRRYGPTDAESPLWPFDQTDYYLAEMGPDVQRQFLAFERPIRPEDLSEIKLVTNALELEIAEQAQSPDIPRPVNIDPGYLDLGKLVLATTKDRAHRVYLGAGIYAEVTLQFFDGVWQVQPWTYPDYRLPSCHAFFDQARTRLREQRRAAETAIDSGQPVL
ncbi:MAG: DUF4416 family protein [Phycisphaerae bacterium]